MKNKAEREAFLRDYQTWDLIDTCIARDGNILLKLYAHRFNNGAWVYVTEYLKYDYKGNICNAHKYHLVLPKGDSYDPFDQHSGRTAFEFLTYTPDGCSIGTIVDYMTKRRDTI